MINPSELRIGNWYFIENAMKAGEKELEQFNNYTDALEFEYRGYPIPLDADWLENLSVQSCREDKGWSMTIFHLHKSDLVNKIPACWVEPDVHGNFLFYYGGYVNGVKVKYVHQLQNLYFALISQDLTIKEKV